MSSPAIRQREPLSYYQGEKGGKIYLLENQERNGSKERTSDTFKYGLPAGPGIPGISHVGLRYGFQTESGSLYGDQRRTRTHYQEIRSVPLELRIPGNVLNSPGKSWNSIYCSQGEIYCKLKILLLEHNATYTNTQSP